MPDDPAPYDHQKWLHEMTRQDAQRAHDQLAQFAQSVNEAAVKGGDAALRAALLINGGAAVSVLAFIGGYSTTSHWNHWCFRSSYRLVRGNATGKAVAPKAWERA